MRKLAVTRSPSEGMKYLAIPDWTSEPKGQRLPGVVQARFLGVDHGVAGGDKTCVVLIETVTVEKGEPRYYARKVRFYPF